MTATRQSVYAEPRGKDTWRLKWRFDGRQQSHTVYSRAEKRSAVLAIESIRCQISGQDPRVKTGSLWRPDVAIAEGSQSFRTVAVRAINAKRGDELTTKPQQLAMLDHALAPFADRPVASITAEDVQSWLDSKPLSTKGTPLADSSLKARGALLLSVLAYAHDKGWRADNPTRDVVLPWGKPRGMAITVEQYEDLLDATPGMQWKLLWHLLTFTGLRIGEAIALQAGDVDLAAGLIHVQRSTRGNKSSMPLGGGKSRNAVRFIDMSPETVKLLRPLVVGAAADSFVFHRPDGRRLAYQTVRWHWCNAVRDAKLPEGLRMHDLRHSHATWLLNDGVPLLVVSRRLGHANIDTTANLYGHISREGRDAVLGSLARRERAARPTRIRQAS